MKKRKTNPQTKPKRLAIKSRVKAGLVIDITGAGRRPRLGFGLEGMTGTEF